MRHAKSSWTSDASSDHARPLSKRGRRDAPRIAARLAELDWIPEQVWSSDSQRTRETWALMAPALGDDVPATFTRRLYHGGLGSLQEASDDWPDDATTLIALGHNPGWEEATSMLSGDYEVMTTANAALLVGDGATWADAMERGWDLEALLRPKELDPQ
jgi:phosphohistidine phosphatase